MTIKSKSQLAIDIAASTFSAPQQTILDDIVDSYEDIFAQLTTVQRDALTPTAGLIIYNTDTDRYEYWNGSAWFGIGQDLSTPLVVKLNITSADLLALNGTPITVASAIGAGYALVPISMAYRFTFVSADYAGGNVVLCNAASSTSDIFTSINNLVLRTANKSGSLHANTGTGINAIVENDDLVLKAPAALTTGDGTLTVWVTYTILTY